MCELNCVMYSHTYMQVCAPVYPFMEARDAGMSCSSIFPCISLSYGLSLSMQLDWWPASLSDLIYSPHSFGVNTCVCPCLTFYVNAGYLNPGPHACMESTFTH